MSLAKKIDNWYFLGMQLLFSESYEIKKTKGLGLLKGDVKNLMKKTKR